MSLPNLFREGIEEWLSKKPSRSLSKLARLSSLSYTTIRRAAQGEADLSLSSAIALGDVIFSRGKLREAISASFPDVAKLALDYYWPKPENDSIYELMVSRDHFPIMMLASNEGGTTRNEILEVFGKRASLPTKQLLEASVLHENDGKISLSQTDFSVPSKTTARANIEAMLSIIDPDNDNIDGASNAYTYTQGLTPEAAKLASEILKDAHKALYRLLSDEKNHGNVLWYSGVFSNILVNGDRVK